MIKGVCMRACVCVFNLYTNMVADNTGDNLLCLGTPRMDSQDHPKPLEHC